MSKLGRKTVAHAGLENHLTQHTPLARNTAPENNEFQMKSYEQLLPHFSNEPGLVYEDYFVYSNNSVYRG
jgi:hypothetical protein